MGSRLVYPGGCRGVDPCGPSRRIPCCRRIGRIDAPLRPFAWFPGAGGSAADRPLRTSLTLRPFASKSPAAAYTRRFVSTLRGRGSGRSIRPLGVFFRSLGLVSWLLGGAYAPTGDVYPFIGSGFVVCWCISEAGRVFHGRRKPFGFVVRSGSRKAYGRGFLFCSPGGVGG